MKQSWKKILPIAGICLGAGTVGFTVLAARFEPAIRKNSFVGDVPIGGLAPDAARKRVRIWWESAKRHELTFRSDLLKKLPPPTTPGKLGITIDDSASVAPAPLDGFGSYLASLLSSGMPAKTEVPVKLKYVGANFETLKRFVADYAGSPSPARVRFKSGQIERVPEIGGYVLDEHALPERLMEAIHGDGVVDLPLIEGPKHVPDDALAQIKDVVIEFSTRFSTGKLNRCNNIKLAAEKLDGVILMPGEAMSFNNTVGRRTVEGGFKEAGVYANGKHDTDIGGGICQVSTTLYNAALLANLKIKQRTNHSMPVPYVPIGRDATVDYGSLDLMIENSYQTPIAITSSYIPGKLTFMILGVKDPALTVEIVGEGHTSWATDVKKVSDPTLPAGSTKVIEKGCSGHSVSTFRLVYKNGELVSREPLGKSIYRGANRIVAVGAKAKVSPKSPDAAGVGPTTSPPPSVPPPGRVNGGF